MFGNQSQFKQQKYQQFEVRKTGYGQTWNTELKTACCADPGCKCFLQQSAHTPSLCGVPVMQEAAAGTECPCCLQIAFLQLAGMIRYYLGVLQFC